VPVRVLSLLRVAFAMLVAAALGYQAASLAERTSFQPERFFAFFTVQSNIFAALMFVLVAVWWAGDRLAWVDALRGAAALFMGVTGVVFALLLAGLQEELQTHVAWVDFVLHRLFPVVVVLDWLLEPPRRRLPLRVAAIWVAYPMAYFVFSLGRGAIDDWYPYPFLDAGELGYGGVALRAAFLLAGVIAAALAVVAVGNWLSERLHRPPEELRPAAET
jgi:hypothetical protein